jgi:hypothetical protein
MRLFLGLIIGLAMMVTSSATAQPVRIALFKTTADDPALSDLAGALDPVILSALNRQSSVQVSALPALDLPSMQLATDCVGENEECLHAAATQAESDGLLAPTVRREGDRTSVSMLLYRAGQPNPLEHVSRSYSGARVIEDAVAGVDGMLRELLGEPSAEPPTEAAPPSSPAEAPQPLAAKPPEAKRPLPIVPIVLGATGLVLIGTGIAFGVASQNTQDEGNRLPANSATEVDEVLDVYDRGATEALVADVTIGLGAAALAAGGVLLFWQLRERPHGDGVTWAPQVGPRTAGLGLRGQWAGL